MKWLLVIVTPDTPASLLAGLLSLLAFAIAALAMWTRDYAEAGRYLHLSMGILVGLFLLKYLSARATYRLAAEADHRLHEHFHRIQEAALEHVPSEAEQHAREVADMTELAKDLQLALDKIHPDSPLRAKYEATLELMARVLAREGARKHARGEGTA